MTLIPEAASKEYTKDNAYDSSPELQFDAKKHFAFEMPKKSKIFDGNDISNVKTGTYRRTTSDESSRFAVSDTFRMFSDSGLAEMRRIAMELKKYSYEGRNKRVRSTWHYSPFMRNMMSSKELLNHMSVIFGEPVLPMMYLSTTGQINYGELGSTRNVDEWHFDSVHFVAVVLLSDITDMRGGELQFIKHPKKVAKHLLESHTLKDADVEKVSYEKSGYCIAAQGSELCHRVTPVEWAKQARSSLVISFMPANVYVKDRFVYQVR